MYTCVLYITYLQICIPTFLQSIFTAHFILKQLSQWLVANNKCKTNCRNLYVNSYDFTFSHRRHFSSYAYLHIRSYVLCTVFMKYIHICYSVATYITLYIRYTYLMLLAIFILLRKGDELTCTFRILCTYTNFLFNKFCFLMYEYLNWLVFIYEEKPVVNWVERTNLI